MAMVLDASALLAYLSEEPGSKVASLARHHSSKKRSITRHDQRRLIQTGLLLRECRVRDELK